MSQRLFLFFLLIILSTPAIAQKAEVYGVVKDNEGLPVEFVSVGIKGGTASTVTDEKGKFSLKVVPDNNFSLVFTYLGYKELEIPLLLAAGQKKNLELELEPDSRELMAVEIVGRRDEVREQASVYSIDPRAAKDLPSPFGDFNKILATLPGVTSSNELSSTYNVRGGNYYENLVYVNDMLIYRPFLVSSGRQEGLSFVNPDLVSNVEFSAGGWQPRFGDKLSSVLNIKYKEPTEFGGSVTAGLLGGAAHLERGFGKGKGSYVVGVRQKRSSYILNTLDVQGQYFPQFTDVQTYVKYTISEDKTTGKSTSIGLLGSYAQNRYVVRPEARETSFGTANEAFRLFVAFEGEETMTYDTWQGGLKFSHSFNDKFRSDLIFSGVYSNEREYFTVEGGYRLCNLNTNFGSENFNKCISTRGVGTLYDHGRNRLEARILGIADRSYYSIDDENEIQFGFNYSWEVIDDGLSIYSFIDSADYVRVDRQLATQVELNSHRVDGYVQHKHRFSPRSSITYGFRLGWWSFNRQLIFSPRVQYAFQPVWERDVVFRFATGVYQQPPFYREMRDQNGVLNENIKAQKSVHLIGGMDYNIVLWDRPFKITGDLYYKYLWDVIPYDVENVRLRYFATNSAVAYAYGADFRISGEFIRGAESWFSFGVLSTREDVENDGRGFIRRPTDQRINVGVYFQDHIPNEPSLKMYLNGLYNTGFPFSFPNNPDLRSNLTVPSYFRVDIGFSKLITFSEPGGADTKFFESVYLGVEVLNILGVSNTISYIFIKDVDNNQFAIPNNLTSRLLNGKVILRF